MSAWGVTRRRERARFARWSAAATLGSRITSGVIRATIAGVRRSPLVLVVCLAGCGRFGFDAVGGSPHGDGNADTQDGPVAQLAAIAAGDAFTCAVRPDQTVACWGEGVNGQLGDGTTVPRPRPGSVSDVTQAMAIAAGSTFTCAATQNLGV